MFQYGFACEPQKQKKSKAWTSGFQPFCRSGTLRKHSSCLKNPCAIIQFSYAKNSIYLINKIKGNRHDGAVVRASASQSVDLGFIPFVESYQKTKNDIHSFSTWRSAFRGGCGEQAGKFACCVLGQGT